MNLSETAEIVIKGSDLRARESMKILSRGANHFEGKVEDLAVEEVRILPFGERFYYRDRFNDVAEVGTPKSSFGGTTVVGDRTFQKGRLQSYLAIRDEAVSIRSFKASEQSFLDRQLNMSGRNSFIIEPRQKASSKSNRSQNYSTMADEDEEEIKNFLDNLDVSFELDYHPEVAKTDSAPKQSKKREC